MKVLALLCALMSLVLVSADNCPADLLKLVKKDVKVYLTDVYKKVGKLKLNCEYNHDSNIFNLEHHVVVKTSYKKRQLSFELKTHSSMFDLYNFTDFNGTICHTANKKLNDTKDRKMIIKAFMKQYENEITNKNVRRTEKKGQVCYKAVIPAKSRLKRSLI